MYQSIDFRKQKKMWLLLIMFCFWTFITIVQIASVYKQKQHYSNSLPNNQQLNVEEEKKEIDKKQQHIVSSEANDDKKKQDDAVNSEVAAPKVEKADDGKQKTQGDTVNSEKTAPQKVDMAENENEKQQHNSEVTPPQKVDKAENESLIEQDDSVVSEGTTGNGEKVEVKNQEEQKDNVVDEAQKLQKEENQRWNTYYDNIINEVTVFRVGAQSTQSCLVFNMVDKFQIHALEKNKEIISAFTTIVYFTDHNASSAFEKSITQMGKAFTKTVFKINAFYQFILEPTEGCKQLIFAEGNFLLSEDIIPLIKARQEPTGQMLAVSAKAKIGEMVFELTNLLKADLSTVPQLELKNCLFFAGKELLTLISPLNFAYNNFYTFHELLIYPLLALTQSSPLLTAFPEVLHEIIPLNSNLNNTPKEFELLDNKVESEDHVCFISYPANCTENNVQLSLDYLSSFKDLNLTKDKFSIAFTVLYIHGDNVFPVAQKVLELQKMNISVVLRMRHLKAEPVLQIYEASFSFCPQKSIFFTSRANTTPKFGKELVDSLSETNNKMVLFETEQDVQKLKKKFQTTPGTTFKESNIKDAQMFKMEDFRRIPLSVFKWKQFQLYQNQLCIILPILGRKEAHYLFINEPFFEVKQKKTFSDVQEQELKLIRSRKLLKIPFRTLSSYNALNNKGLKRNAPQVMPRIIHQIWLSKSNKPSREKAILEKSMRDMHPSFEYRLWKHENLTRENFPHCYDSINKIIRASQGKGKINYVSMAAGIMRIEILYHHGGMYFDYKVEPFKSMIPFLKYEQFFLYVGMKSNSHSGTLVNGVIGSVRHNPKFLKIMTKQFDIKNIKIPPPQSFESMTGANALAREYSERDIEIRVVDISPLTMGQKRVCIYNNRFDPNKQEIFQGKTLNRKPYKVGLPCLAETEQYFQIYYVFGRTRVVGKPFS